MGAKERMIPVSGKLRVYLEIKLLLKMIGLFFLTSVCQASDESVTQEFLRTAQIDDLKLELYSQQDQCAIRLNKATKGWTTNGEWLLAIPYPCGFVRVNKNSSAQTYHYKGIGHVFVVAGPLIDKSAYTKDTGVKPEHLCSNQGQAIILQGKVLKLRPGQHVPFGFCHHLGFDEKVYYGYAHPLKQ